MNLICWFVFSLLYSNLNLVGMAWQLGMAQVKLIGTEEFEESTGSEISDEDEGAKPQPRFTEEAIKALNLPALIPDGGIETYIWKYMAPDTPAVKEWASGNITWDGETVKRAQAEIQKYYENAIHELRPNEPGDPEWPGFMQRMQEAVLKGNKEWRKNIGIKEHAMKWPEGKSFLLTSNLIRITPYYGPRTQEENRLEDFERMVRTSAYQWHHENASGEKTKKQGDKPAT